MGWSFVFLVKQLQFALNFEKNCLQSSLLFLLRKIKTDLIPSFLAISEGVKSFQRETIDLISSSFQTRCGRRKLIAFLC